MSDTLDHDLARYLGALADHVDGAVDTAPTLPSSCPSHPRRGRRWMAAALVLLVSGLGAALLATLGSGADGPQVTDESPPDDPPTPDPSPPETATSAWRTIEQSGLEIAEREPHAVWMLSDFFVLHAENRGGDPIAARIEPVTGEVTAVPGPPIGWRTHATVVWTGREVLVVGGSSGVGLEPFGAAYDPMAGTWREVAAPDAPDEVTMLAVQDGVWTGSELVFWRAGRAYDPAADRWRSFPAAPLSERTGAAAVAIGEDILVWGGCEPVVDCYQRPESWLDDGAVYSAATGEWADVPEGPVDAAPHAAAVSDGASATVVALQLEGDGGDGNAVARFDPRSGWTDLPDPDRVPWYGADLTQVGDAVVLTGPAHGAHQWLVLRSGAERWEPIPEPAITRRLHALADGRGHLLVAGGSAGGAPEVLAIDEAWAREVPHSLDIPVEVVESSSGPFARYVQPDELPAGTAYLSVYVDGRAWSRTSAPAGASRSFHGTELQRGATVSVQIVAEDIDMLPLAATQPVVLEPT